MPRGSWSSSHHIRIPGSRSEEGGEGDTDTEKPCGGRGQSCLSRLPAVSTDGEVQLTGERGAWMQVGGPLGGAQGARGARSPGSRPPDTPPLWRGPAVTSLGTEHRTPGVPPPAAELRLSPQGLRSSTPEGWGPTEFQLQEQHRFHSWGSKRNENLFSWGGDFHLRRPAAGRGGSCVSHAPVQRSTAGSGAGGNPAPLLCSDPACRSVLPRLPTQRPRGHHGVMASDPQAV